MIYAEFERIMSPPRMRRYVQAVNGDTRRAMTLCRRNLKLSQELFTIISCFEVALRNAINVHYAGKVGADWLRDSVSTGGMFDIHPCRRTANLIRTSYRKLGTKYTHPKLVAEMDFGFWRYLFAQPQFRAGGQTLLQIFPAKPTSTPAIQYNHTYVFNQLKDLNEIRNRIAHHEPVCFQPGRPVKDTTFARQKYNQVLMLFQWMNVNEASLLYGLDHVLTICDEIDSM